MSDKQEFNWIAFCIHFVLGLIFGAIVGFFVWIKTPYTESGWAGFCYIGVGGLIFALLAAFIGDDFWHRLGEFIGKR